MKGKAALTVGAMFGYLFGTRAGRQRYEQIRGGVRRFWQDPNVQKKVAQAQDFARQKAPLLREKLGQAAQRTGQRGVVHD